MTAPVFVSHSYADEAAARDVCDALEAAGVPCWIAPRDIRPSEKFDVAIVRAIESCRALLIVYTERTLDSEYVADEVQLGRDAGRPLVLFRLEDAPLSDPLRLALGRVQWFDAFPPPLAPHVARLADLLSDPEHGSSRGPKTGSAPRGFARSSRSRILGAALGLAGGALAWRAGILPLLPVPAADPSRGEAGMAPAARAGEPSLAGSAPASLALPEEPLRVTAFRSEDGRLVRRDTVGDPLRFVALDHGLRVRATLGGTAHAFLIALEPDGRIELLHPLNRDQPPPALERFDAPDGTSEYRPSTTGALALLLVASADPLPAFSEWVRGVDGFRWESSTVPDPLVYDGRGFDLPFTLRGSVGRSEWIPEPLRRLIESVERHDPELELRAVAFEVRAE